MPIRDCPFTNCGSGIYRPILPVKTVNPHIYTAPETPIDFMPNLHVVLLGVNSFLSRFVLTVDYPAKNFSITTQ